MVDCGEGSFDVVDDVVAVAVVAGDGGNSVAGGKAASAGTTWLRRTQPSTAPAIPVTAKAPNKSPVVIIKLAVFPALPQRTCSEESMPVARPVSAQFGGNSLHASPMKKGSVNRYATGKRGQMRMSRISIGKTVQDAPTFVQFKGFLGCSDCNAYLGGVSPYETG